MTPRNRTVVGSSNPILPKWRCTCVTILALLALSGCRPSLRAPQKACVPVADLHLSSDKTAFLLTEIYARSTLEELNTPKIVRRFCYQAEVVNKQQYGLYSFDDLSHQAPLSVLLSKDHISVVHLAFNNVGTRDSVEKALAIHGKSFTARTRKLIFKHFN